MELGEKIRQTRLEAGLSQRQVCEDVITRNMLSRIEHGSVHPSMQTLCYLAKRLGRPVSYFLEEEAVLLPNANRLMQARQSFSQGAYEEAVQTLEECEEETQPWERNYLLYLCRYRLAQQALNDGALDRASSLLQQAVQAGQQTAYFTQADRRELVLLEYQLQPEQAQALSQQLPADDRECCLRAQAALQAGSPDRAEAILRGAEKPSARFYLLQGEALFSLKRYQEAAESYRQAEDAYPAEVIPRLEICYRELEDYRQAYLYACKQRKA